MRCTGEWLAIKRHAILGAVGARREIEIDKQEALFGRAHNEQAVRIWSSFCASSLRVASLGRCSFVADAFRCTSSATTTARVSSRRLACRICCLVARLVSRDGLLMAMATVYLDSLSVATPFLGETTRLSAQDVKKGTVAARRQARSETSDYAQQIDCPIPKGLQEK